jgi:hypothetical protein
MIDDQLARDVRELRAKGLSPKEIARALGVRPAAVADIVRTIAIERSANEPASLSCLVSPGWDVGLSFEGHPEWPTDRTAKPEASGLVLVLVSREDRNRQVSVCGFLLDVYCLGVKNAVGPRRMRRDELGAYTAAYFSAWDGSARPIPIDLARHLVFGSADYARALGFSPHADFARAARQLEPWDGPSDIRFGCDGVPFYTEGPYDDAEQVLSTLESTVGTGNFHYTVSVGEAFVPASAQPPRSSRLRGRRKAA